MCERVEDGIVEQSGQGLRVETMSDTITRRR